jgi:hypothetical protein
MQGGEAVQSRRRLVGYGVVLHRAGAKRIEGRGRAQVPLRQPQEVAQHVGLADLGEPVDRLAQQLGGQEGSGLCIATVHGEGAPSGPAAFEDQRLVEQQARLFVPVSRGAAGQGSFGVLGHA